MNTPIVRQPEQPGNGNGNGNGNPPNLTDGEKPCPSCGSTRVALSWRPFGQGKRHIRATCIACGAWCYWALQTDGNIALANAAPSAD